MKKIRLDVLLVERGLVNSRTQAQRLVMAGQVLVNNQVVLKSSVTFDAGVQLEIVQKPRFVSRGGEKLEAALKAFQLENLDGWICADVGASTGGFTDCLLQHKAARVYAIDVGYGEMHWTLRNDNRVITMERTNARFLQVLPETINLVTVDASFISLRLLLPVISGWYGETGGHAVTLIKPQFEAGKKDAARGKGVIRDAHIHRQVILDVLDFAQKRGFGILDVIRSPVVGAKGNVEFLAHMVYPGKVVENLHEKIAKLGFDNGTEDLFSSQRLIESVLVDVPLDNIGFNQGLIDIDPGLC